MCVSEFMSKLSCGINVEMGLQWLTADGSLSSGALMFMSHDTVYMD